MTIVDLHCHTFNAADIPVEEFVTQALHQPKYAKLAGCIGRVAPGIDCDLAIIEDLRGSTASSATFDELLPNRAEWWLYQHRIVSPMYARRLRRWARPPGSREAVETAWLDRIRLSVLHGFATFLWTVLLPRTLITAAMARNSRDEVDLYTPLSVDLGLGATRTTARQQMEVHAEISKLTMRERLPFMTRGRVHPFVGFHPGNEDALTIVKEAVGQFGHIGVKVYPPMGYYPCGNEARGEDRGAQLDAALEALYAWCEQEDVPILTHTTSANAVHPGKMHADPAHWTPVLLEHPRLRLALGHFGGAERDAVSEIYRANALALIDRFPGVYADVGNHRITSVFLRRRYFKFLRRAMADSTSLSERLAFSSDWHFVQHHGRSWRFLPIYRRTYRCAFGDENCELFMGGNALRFLGLDDPTNQNNVRLRKWYADAEVHPHPHWLAGPPA